MAAHRMLCSALILGLLGLSSACANTGAANKKDKNAVKRPAPTCIAVLPAQADLSEGQENAGNLETGVPVLDAILHNALSENAKIRFLGAGQTEAFALSDSMVNLEAARTAAQSVGCNAMLETSLARYVERDGGPYGVQNPAAVTLHYRLYSVEDGGVLCHGRFDEKQQALTEDLFSISKVGRRHMTWLSAEELAREGLTEQLGKCSYLEK